MSRVCGWWNEPVWVVEMQDGPRWRPTAGAYLTRVEARAQMESDWRENCPSDRFRVRQYARVEDKR